MEKDVMYRKPRTAEEILQKITEEEQICKYCRYSGECPRGVVCYGGEPSFPPCADNDIRECIDVDDLMVMYEDGELDDLFKDEEEI